MGSRPDHINNVAFLFKCIESTGVKIDFGKAGPALGIKPNAARMRYVRLRKAVEEGRQLQSSPIAHHSQPCLNAPAIFPSVSTEDSAGKRAQHDGTAEEAEKIEKIDEDAQNKANAKPRTRGIKIDYSQLDPEVESGGSCADSEDLSDYTASIGQDDEHIASATKHDHEKERHIVPTMVATQPTSHVSAAVIEKRVTKRKGSIIAEPVADIDHSNVVLSEIAGLASGQRLLSHTFKKRKVVSVGTNNDAFQRKAQSEVPVPPVICTDASKHKHVQKADQIGAGNQCSSVDDTCNHDRQLRRNPNPNPNPSSSTGFSWYKWLSSYW